MLSVGAAGGFRLPQWRLCYRVRVPKQGRKNTAPGSAASPAVSLPVIQPRGLRPRNPSLWRTMTLIAVHLIMIAHFTQWILGV